MSTEHLPERFIERMRAIYPQDADAFFEHCEKPLPKTIRWEGETDIPADWKVRPTIVPKTYFWEDERPLGKTIEHFSGRVYSQSLSSMLPVLALDLEGDEKVLDMCAAPGSKTTQLSTIIGHEGCIIANEISSSRSKKLVANLTRMGAKNVIVTQHDGTKLNNSLMQEFDAVLLDAPCSSEGFARRSKDYLKKHWNERYIKESAQLQKTLIISAFEVLRPGGVMVYSTCTSAPEENELVVQTLLWKYPELVEIEPITCLGEIPHLPGIPAWEGNTFDPQLVHNCARFSPHARTQKWDSESFFLCRIRKTGAIKKPVVVKKSANDMVVRLPKNARAEVLVKLVKMYGIPREAFKGWEIAKRDGAYYLTTNRAIGYAMRNPFRRIGMQIIDKYGGITNAFAWAFGAQVTLHDYTLDQKDEKSFIAGTDIRLTEPLEIPNSQQIIVKAANGLPLGVGKVLKNGALIKINLSEGIPCSKYEKELIHKKSIALSNAFFVVYFIITHL